MLKLLPPPIKGAMNYGLLGLNTIVHSVPLLTLAGLKLIPIQQWKTLCSQGLITISENWISLNSALLDFTQHTRYHVTGLDKLEYEGWYMVISNHQSWADILILQKVFNRKIPFLKFFLKKELIWVPVIGLCWWALDFPFMQRYSKELLIKHPELKGKDLEITKKACEKFKHLPVSIMNFLEGTRYTQAKHDAQQSPYQHLLKPKSGGIAYAIGVMAEEINTLVDVTIYYPDGHKGNMSFWNFMAGRSQDIHIHIETREIPSEMKYGDYENDDLFRKRFQGWIHTLWQEKDALLDQLSQKNRS
ncbi:1-acyl-sn-glycerol-3-phosphate acyltransferase [Fluviicoccus keumensis]|uniref:1-acyl-sn-glycerol-3-phosphate acyltransferase n=1 Tax=Fluviicoccus keumensis TaxID=1435465 RepID=A0A4Q7YIL3_9GAMM|nr:acyltransferase [Fluviicoccus keumensis]RZU36978.1 1-acyl-sn-glycerol-3-phosphate acyltransferase [Fluviicoccus keumensis]